MTDLECIEALKFLDAILRKVNIDRDMQFKVIKILQVLELKFLPKEPSKKEGEEQK